MAETPVDNGDGIGVTIVQVAEDARAYAAAQVALYKALASARFRAARIGLILGAAAMVLGLSAVTGLVIGAIFALAPRFGAWGATLIVVGVVSVIVAILGRLAAVRLARAFGEIE